MTNQALTFATSNIPIGSLDAYIARAYATPMLSAEQEQHLAKRLLDGDLEAARHLVFSHIRFVVYVARKYQSFGLPLADLIQEGTVGMMKAVKRFDPERGVRLATFAMHWIKSEIHEFVLKNWRIVKMATTKAQRKLFFNLNKFKANRRSFSSEDISFIAKSLNVDASAVITMEQRMFSDADYNYDEHPKIDDASWQSQVVLHAMGDDRYDPAKQIAQLDETHQTSSNLANAIATLDERSQTIIAKRWLSETKTSLKVLAEQFGISIERVRQLEQKAIKRLKHHLIETAA